MAHKILIIDDEETTVILVQSALAEKRYDVIVADDGKKGILKVDSEKPDLIVLDVQMPNMNGFEFMTELKQIQGFETTPVIMLTSNETMQDVFLLEGVKGYFIKPLEPVKLIAKIQECLGPNPPDGVLSTESRPE